MLSRTLVRNTVLGLALLLLAAGLLGLLLRAPLMALSSWFVDRFGLAGVFAGVWFADTSPLPLTHEPVLLLGVSAGLDSWVLFATAALASVLAGPSGYLGGWLLRRNARLREWLEGRAPDFVRWMREHGVRGVVLAALLPLPFAVSTWSAGMTTVNFPKVLLASLLRIPTTGFYLFLVIQGWKVGA